MATNKKFAINEKAILVVGLHSSGKTTLSQAFASTGPYAIFELGDGVREIALRSGMTNLVRIASEILSGSDPTKLATLAIEKAKALETIIPVFVGARTVKERDQIVSSFAELIIIGLSVPQATRKIRWKQRQITATDQWAERELWESSWQTMTLVNEAHIKLTATDPTSKLCLKITSELKNLWKQSNA